jgi:hypothetical protein
MHAARWTAIIVSTFTLAISACARNGALQESASADASDAPRTIAVTVKNSNYWDMKVYALVDGSVPLRIGTVVGMSSSRFTARRSMVPTGRLRLVAQQIGGRNVADSGELQVGDGQSVTFTIQPNTATSFALVR